MFPVRKSMKKLEEVDYIPFQLYPILAFVSLSIPTHSLHFHLAMYPKMKLKPRRKLTQRMLRCQRRKEWV